MNLDNQADQLANLRSLFCLQWTWPGKKTLFMGCEFGQWKEWNADEELDWALLDFPIHLGLKKLVSDLNKLYRKTENWALFDHESAKFQWIDCDDNKKFDIIRKVTERQKRSKKKIINIDGVRVSEKDGWWLLRASNTQPAIVLRCESLTQEGLEFQKRSVEE